MKNEKLFGHSEAYDPCTGDRMYFSNAEGCYVWNSNNDKYIDLVNGDGAILIGHNNPKISKRFIQKFEKHGNLVTGISPSSTALIEKLKPFFWSDSLFSFFSSGTEAALAVYWGYKNKKEKPIVLSSGYHGWAPVWNSSKEIGDPNEHNVVDFYFQLSTLQKCIKKYKNQIGLICLSPDFTWFDNTYYEEFFKIIDQTDALVFIDDCMQGFRYSSGPSLKKYLDKIDIISISKGISGGSRLTTVVTKPKAVDLLGDINSSTAHEASALTLVEENINFIIEENIYEKIAKNGKYFIEKFKNVLKNETIPIDIVGNGQVWQLIFNSSDNEQVFSQKCFERKVLYAPYDTQKPSAAFTIDVYNKIISIFEEVLLEMKREGLFGNKELTVNSYAEAASYVIHGVPSIINIDAEQFISTFLIPQTTDAGLVKDQSEFRSSTMWKD